MTKQQIVVQIVAAKIANSGVIPHKDFLEQCGVAADKIIEMFPEPSTEITYSGAEINRADLINASVLRATIKASEDK